MYDEHPRAGRNTQQLSTGRAGRSLFVHLKAVNIVQIMFKDTRLITFYENKSLLASVDSWEEMFRHRPTMGKSTLHSFKLLPALFQPPTSLVNPMICNLLINNFTSTMSYK